MFFLDESPWTADNDPFVIWEMAMTAPAIRKERLSAQERLRGRDRFEALFATGQVGKARLVLVRLLPNDLPYCRVAVIAGRKIGKAHKRVRIRRRLRAAFRIRKTALPTGYDIALVARYGVIDASFPALCADVVKAVRRAVDGTGRNPSHG